MTRREQIHRLLAAFAVGVGFIYTYTFVIGFVAAVAFPRWYVPFARENTLLALFLWDLATTVPVAVVVSAVFGYVLARLISGSYLAVGILAVLFSRAIWILLYPTAGDHLQTIRELFLPGHIIYLPAYVALFVSLPLAAWYFGRRASVV